MVIDTQRVNMTRQWLCEGTTLDSLSFRSISGYSRGVREACTGIIATDRWY